MDQAGKKFDFKINQMRRADGRKKNYRLKNLIRITESDFKVGTPGYLKKMIDKKIDTSRVLRKMID